MKVSAGDQSCATQGLLHGGGETLSALGPRRAGKSCLFPSAAALTEPGFLTRHPEAESSGVYHATRALVSSSTLQWGLSTQLLIFHKSSGMQ